MSELIRFQHLRPATVLRAEQASTLGLPLYPDGEPSSFAQALLAEQDREKYRALVARFSKGGSGAVIMSPDDLNPVIRAFAEWLDFKATPIRRDDLEAFAQSLDPSKLSDVKAEWTRIADSLLVGIEEDLVSTRYHVDYQLLVRIAAAPVDDAANEALIELLARVLGVAKRSVDIVGGHRGRTKRVAIAGLSAAEVERRVAAVLK